MSLPVRLASFCRLCLSKTKEKVPIFADGNLLDNLLQLIEISIDPDIEPDAVVCYDCVVTLEGFHQFKEQCRVNDELVKTVPPTLKCSESLAEEDEDENEDNTEEAFMEVEDDRTELSEAEEVVQESPRRRSTRKTRKTYVRSPSPEWKPAIQYTAKALSKEEEERKSRHIDELQVLAESYPDYFYFEKGARSIYYTMVFYGERYNSALFYVRNTYWQCMHRRKYKCKALVVVTNDYKNFERRHEHSHGQLPEEEGQAFTPLQALPEMFQICKRKVMQNWAKYAKPVSSESKVQEFAADIKIKKEDDDAESASPTNETKPTLPVDDLDEETEVVTGSRPKRKIMPNARYSDGQAAPKKPSVEPETKPNEPEDDNIEEEYLDLGIVKIECEDLDV